jgi:hypothetical protein
MKKERQIGIRVGLPVSFAMEVEDVYRHTSGAHRALAYPDFLGLLIGLGLEEYRRVRGARPEEPGLEDDPEAPDNEPEEEPLNLFDMTPKGLKDMFRDYEELMGPPPAKWGLRLARPGADDDMEEA